MRGEDEGKEHKLREAGLTGTAWDRKTLNYLVKKG